MLVNHEEAEILSAMIALAIRVDNRIYENKRDKSSIGRATPPFQRYRRSNVPPATTGLAPADGMDLDAMNSRRGPFTQAERDHRFQNNLCIVCASPDHRKFNCPKKRVDFPERQ